LLTSYSDEGCVFWCTYIQCWCTTKKKWFVSIEEVQRLKLSTWRRRDERNLAKSNVTFCDPTKTRPFLPAASWRKLSDVRSGWSRAYVRTSGSETTSITPHPHPRTFLGAAFLLIFPESHKVYLKAKFRDVIPRVRNLFE
jgi:hypothetical protein